MNFKVGDKIIRIGKDFAKIKQGQIYTVFEVIGDNLIKLAEHPDSIPFMSSKFKLVNLEIFKELGD